MQAFSDSKKTITGINVTPLVDIALVLLIIFMATAPLIQKRVLGVNVPKSQTGEPKATETLQIFFNAQRQISLEGRTITADQLNSELVGLVRADPNVHVSLAADESIPYGEVVRLLDVVRGAGARKVALDIKLR